MLADVEVRRPALKASGHVVVDKLVGSLFHCLIVAGRKEWQRADWSALACVKRWATRVMESLRWIYWSMVISI